MNKINHIAIIMDGNGRWGEKGKSRNFGHLNGIKVIEKIVKFIKIKIPTLTFYTFSTENWKGLKRKLALFDS